MLIDEARALLARVDACSTGEEPVVDDSEKEENVWQRLKAARYFGIFEEEISLLLKRKYQK